MRSKFAMWSDEGILSKPGATGFARLRLIVLVCSVCGIAAASVYSQIGPDRGTTATDRATGYGTDGPPVQAERAQSPEPLSTIDAYVRSGATTGVASAARAAAKSTAKLAPRPTAAEPLSIAASQDMAAKPAHPPAASELTRTSSDSNPRSVSKSDVGDAATATAATNSETGNKAARASGNLYEKRRNTRRSARRIRDDNYVRFESPGGRERSGFAEFGPPPDGRRNSFSEFEPWDRRGRNEDARGGRRYSSQFSPFNWFGAPFQ
jgi:hypothetical protein